MITTLYSDPFLFWSIIFIFSVPLGHFLYSFFSERWINIDPATNMLPTLLATSQTINILWILTYLYSEKIGDLQGSFEIAIGLFFGAFLFLFSFVLFGINMFFAILGLLLMIWLEDKKKFSEGLLFGMLGASVIFLILPWVAGFSWLASILIDIGILCFWFICLVLSGLGPNYFGSGYIETPSDNGDSASSSDSSANSSNDLGW